MPVDIHQFACLEDNYGYLLRDRATGCVAAIDVPDAKTLLTELRRLGWSLELIINTHWHRDHTGGNDEVRAATGAPVVGPREVARRSLLNRPVVDGDVIRLGETQIVAMACAGHTLGHLCYHVADDEVLFSGDVLFALGCGRLFEGTPAQMWASLSRLAALPGETRVYCAHEYTASNAAFATTVDDDPTVAARAAATFEQRARGAWTVPTTIALERATNPFLRAPLLRPELDAVEAFAAIRAAKDAFRG